MRKTVFFLVLPLVAIAAPSRSFGSYAALEARHDDDEHESQHEHELASAALGQATSAEQSEPDISHTPWSSTGDEHDEPDSEAGHSSPSHPHDQYDDLENDRGADPTPHAHSHIHSEGVEHPHKASAAESAHHAASHHHSHGAHTAPKVILNDSEIHYWHSFPPSYLAADFRLDEDTAIFGEEFPQDWNGCDGPAGEGQVPGKETGKRGLMVLHVVAMCVAYFGALPIALALRAASHAAHHLANLVFLGIALAGWMAGAWYKAATPDRYEGESHSGLGNMLVLLSLGLSMLDSLGLLKRAAGWYRRTPKGQRSFALFKRDVLVGANDDHDSQYRLASAADIGGARRSMREGYSDLPESGGEVVFAIGDDHSDAGDEHAEQTSHIDGEDLARATRQRVMQHGRTRYSTGSARSSGSEHTLRDSPTSGTPPVGYPFLSMSSAEAPAQKYKRPLEMGAYDAPSPSLTFAQAAEEYADGYAPEAAFLPEQPIDESGENEHGRAVSQVGDKGRMSVQRFGEVCLTWIRRSQVVLAYVSVLSGIAIYTGMCRASYLPSCLAHYIKGSIFFGYGVLTFARYLGAYADMGWSWNRSPSGAKGPSAEMVECAIIFTYGITNTWMERFGAHKGDPYTVKQVQHISIAVMFWFAGLSGMLLESKIIRRVLGSAVGNGSSKQPTSYAFSFNPLPALVIAVTGLAMAAHHQDYLFQVQIHSLWGILLAGGSLFRMLTYIFLWLRPPVESTLPSRPPTEVLTAFGWATGGIVFILSSEEVMYAAMRAGYDDMMAFLNVTVALTALVFCWEVVVLGMKGWAVSRVKGERMGDVEI